MLKTIFRAKIDDFKFLLFWNPSFLATLTVKEIFGLLKHECYHLVFEHTTTRRMTPHIIHNYATDLAINSHLQGELPEMACMPGVGPFEDLPLHQTAEWYLANLNLQRSALALAASKQRPMAMMAAGIRRMV